MKTEVCAIVQSHPHHDTSVTTHLGTPDGELSTSASITSSSTSQSTQQSGPSPPPLPSVSLTAPSHVTKPHGTAPHSHANFAHNPPVMSTTPGGGVPHYPHPHTVHQPHQSPNAIPLYLHVAAMCEQINSILCSHQTVPSPAPLSEPRPQQTQGGGPPSTPHTPPTATPHTSLTVGSTERSVEPSTASPSEGRAEGITEAPASLSGVPLPRGLSRPSVGVVVGATDVDAVRLVRCRHPDIWILAPGVGAQGGELGDVLRAGLRPDGEGLIIPVSRSIARALDKRASAEKLKGEINSVRSQVKAATSALSSLVFE